MERSEQLHEFLRQNYYTELMKLSSEDKPALVVDFQLLDRFNPTIADELLDKPLDILKDFEKAVEDFGLGVVVPVRLQNLPERRIIRIRNLRAEHIGKLIMTDIIVKSASEVKPQINKAWWKCPECENELCVVQDEAFLMQKITRCNSCGRRGDFGEPTRTAMIDTRMLKGVEPFEITEGEQPSEMVVWLKEDLTTPRMQKKTDPGARIRIVGWLKELPKRVKGKLSTKLDTYIDANYVEPSEIEFEDIEITPEDEAAILSLSRDPAVYQKLRNSIAPGIFGYEDVKEAIALQLFGGLPHRLPDSSHIRGNIHILLTGDPSVGKTILLKLASNIVPRGKYVSGSGVTGVGLCTTGDSIIQLADGRLINIKDLVERRLKISCTKEGNNIHTSPGDGAMAMGLDAKSLRFMPMQITKYWKLKCPAKLIKIVTRMGKEIRVTPENPIPIIENGELVWKVANEIRIKSYIATPRTISVKASGDRVTQYHGREILVSEMLSSLPQNLLCSYLRGLFDTDGCVSIPRGKGSACIGFTAASRDFAKGIQALLLRFGIISKLRQKHPTKSAIRGRDVISRVKYELEIGDIGCIRQFAVHIGFGIDKKAHKLQCLLSKNTVSNSNTDVIPNIGNLLRKARLESNLTAKQLYGYKGYAYEKERRAPTRAWLQHILTNLRDNKWTRHLSLLASSDIFWDEIISVEVVEGEDFVYDITVDGEHSFIANGLVIHNTASVRKDEILGTWMLEAGALVLANRGLISIDEFDKMSQEDQIAMHEAMSVETISIAKASIVATLPAQTSVLAGANPKLGRFDPYKSIVEQILIPETLMSRFDLKFVMRDLPDRDKDERLASHVLTGRLTPQSITPEVSIKLLRKYIAYSKKIENIELSKDAADLMKKFYVDMRSSGGDVISITLRQYEALLRLAEASARIRLDSTVRMTDAERAIRLMNASLIQLGYDYESGHIDVDRFEGGITAAQRSKIRIVIDIIERLQKELGKEVPLQDVEAAAEDEGVTNAAEVIDKLKREGLVFEPKPGYIKKT